MASKSEQLPLLLLLPPQAAVIYKYSRYRVSFLSVEIIGCMQAATAVICQTSCKRSFLKSFLLFWMLFCSAGFMWWKLWFPIQWKLQNLLWAHTQSFHRNKCVWRCVKTVGFVHAVCLCVPFSVSSVNAVLGSLFPATSGVALYRPAHFPLNWMAPARSLNVHSRWGTQQ